MATPLPNAKLFSPHSLTAPRFPFLHYFSRSSFIFNGEKSVRDSTISSRRQRECSISFTFRRRSGFAYTSEADFSEEEKDEWDNEEEDEEDEDEGGEYMPLREMASWLHNKPAGFGEGLKYDTTVEDKILEEMNRNKQDQIEGNSKSRARKKDNAGNVKKHEKPMVTEVIKGDPEVRVWNLPKKKNIDRDLRKAFEGFRGIISINPAVTGSKKTRDPICRGFAFIGFESDDAAYGFFQKYSNQNLIFGKVQKQISCDLINVHGDFNSSQSSKSSSTLQYRCSNNEFSISNASETYQSTNGTEPNNEEFPVLSNGPNISSSNNENEGAEDLQFINSSMLANQNRKKISKRGERKPTKSSKGHIPRSLAKLKIKDRALLTGVFSKYGEVASAATKKV